MKTMTKTLTAAALALCGTVLSAGTASAQPWNHAGYGSGYGGYGGYGGYRSNYRDPREEAARDQYLVDTTCSGRRAYSLQTRLQTEVEQGQINNWTARRIQSAINDLQARERYECRARNYYSARDIGKAYVRLRGWLDIESGRRPAEYVRR